MKRLFDCAQPTHCGLAQTKGDNGSRTTGEAASVPRTAARSLSVVELGPALSVVEGSNTGQYDKVANDHTAERGLRLRSAQGRR